MSKMIPGEALIYEKSNDVIYAHYRDPPYNKIPRWIIGGSPAGVASAQGAFLSYSEWKEMCELSLEYPTLKNLMDQLVTMYYTVQDYK